MITKNEMFAIARYTAQIQEYRREIARLNEKIDRVERRAALVWGYQWQDGKFVKQAPATTEAELKSCMSCDGKKWLGISSGNIVDGIDFGFQQCPVCGGTGLDCSDNDEVEE